MKLAVYVYDRPANLGTVYGKHVVSLQGGFVERSVEIDLPRGCRLDTDQDGCPRIYNERNEVCDLSINEAGIIWLHTDPRNSVSVGAL